MMNSNALRPVLNDDWALSLGRWGSQLLRLLPAEWAHEVGMRMLSAGLLQKLPRPKLERFLRADMGLGSNLPAIGPLPHPLGLAAGFDKDARCPQAFKAMGFSFLEVGTVTPVGQAGNPKPRLFRQPEQRAIINRMGFNNAGSHVVAERLRSYRWDHDSTPLGVNAGKNKQTAAGSAIGDYLQVLRAFAALGRYFVVNISSPNTAGLRDLANKYFLAELAGALRSEDASLLAKTYVKLDPDMSRAQLQEVVAAVAEGQFAGLIMGNTHRVEQPQAGGQSGHPLAIQSTTCLEWAYEVHRGLLPMIGCGGILSGADLYQKIIRGAAAAQIYTALVYRGPWVVWELLVELAYELNLRGFSHVKDAQFTFYTDASVSRSLS